MWLDVGFTNKIKHTLRRIGTTTEKPCNLERNLDDLERYVSGSRDSKLQSNQHFSTPLNRFVILPKTQIKILWTAITLIFQILGKVSDTSFVIVGM